MSYTPALLVGYPRHVRLDLALRPSDLTTLDILDPGPLIPAGDGPLGQGPTVPGGRYRMGPVLHRGGHGVVHQGTDLLTGQSVAVKVLSSEFRQHPSATRMFETEAAAGRAANHPALARTLDYVTGDGQEWLVQEFAEGKSLAAWVRHDGPMPFGQAAQILGQVARGLRALHLAGIVHRDVSDVNIVWNGTQAKLVDFGIAQPTGESAVTHNLEIPGNPEFLAPELSLGRMATEAVDIYALGMVMWCILTGQRPYHGATPEDTAVAHVMRPKPSLPMGLPSTLRSLLALMLDKDPARRPAHAGVIASCLEQFATSDPGADQS